MPIKFAGEIALTLSGFVIAILANIFVPQVSPDVIIEDYQIGSLTVNMNIAYRFILGLIAAFVNGKNKAEEIQKKNSLPFCNGLTLVHLGSDGNKAAAFTPAILSRTCGNC